MSLDNLYALCLPGNSSLTWTTLKRSCLHKVWMGPCWSLV